MTRVRVVSAVASWLVLMLLIVAAVTSSCSDSDPYRRLQINGVECIQESPGSTWNCP